MPFNFLIPSSFGNHFLEFCELETVSVPAARAGARSSFVDVGAPPEVFISTSNFDSAKNNNMKQRGGKRLSNLDE